MTASGRNLINPEVNRNERAPQCGVATIEIADEPLTTRSAGNFVNPYFFSEVRHGQIRN